MSNPRSCAIAIIVGSMLSACTAAPPRVPPAASRWLGCYVLQHGTVTESLQVRLGWPTDTSRQAGFEPVWPESPALRRAMSSTSEFTAPVWRVEADTLLITRGFLSVDSITIYPTGETLAAALKTTYDLADTQRSRWDSAAGRYIVRLARDEYAAAIRRVACEPGAT